MIKLKGDRLSPDLLESHNHICDLINVEYPVLSLYTDGRQNWIYLWCDRSPRGINRWIIFPTTRELLGEYLTEKTSMLTLVKDAESLWILENAGWVFTARANDKSTKKPRRHLYTVTIDQLEEYLPTEDSYFDKSLTNDLDLSRELLPTAFDLPIKGSWYSADFLYLFKRYERLYAFFYATRPRFVKSIDDTLSRLLRSPWKGGFSRFNFFLHLSWNIPGMHSLKVQELVYRSPGAIKFQAISDIGESIQRSIVLLMESKTVVTEACERVGKVLSSARLKKVDLSKFTDADVRLDDSQLKKLLADCCLIASTLQVVDEIETLRTHSPNTVVYSKAVLSFVRQLDKLVDLRRRSMFNF
jgi:hypothetical protein